MATALITGATSGIGAAFARNLAARGNDLVLVARDLERLNKTASELSHLHGINCEVLRADLSSSEDVQRVCERLLAEDHPVEVLVNNAGFAVKSELIDPDTSEALRAFDVMVKAVYLLGNAAGRAMAGRGHGQIINVGSAAAFLAYGNYSAIKCWVNNYSESLHCHLRDYGVRVTCMAPGWIRTELHSRAGVSSEQPAFVWGDADAAVEETLTAAQRGKIFYTPQRRWQAAVWLAQHVAWRGILREISYRLYTSRKKH